MYINITFVGYLGRDPQLRYLPDGTAVADLSVAVTERRGNPPKDRTIWIKVSVWGAQAENVNQYLVKGRPVLVEGSLLSGDDGTPRIWNDKSGNARASFEVKARRVVFLPSGKGPGNATADDADDDAPF